MKIVIDIPEEVYKCVMDGTYCGTLYDELKNGTPLPDGAEILTKEAYSDLCSRAADVPNFESKEYIEQRLENYNKLLKSGMLDCVNDKAEPCDDVPGINVGDLIRRQAALEILDDYAEDIESGNWGTAYSKARKSMCDLPFVESERKPGKWIENKWSEETCSECGYIHKAEGTNYCPNCGAKMEVDR